jgi:hypothetical protein
VGDGAKGGVSRKNCAKTRGKCQFPGFPRTGKARIDGPSTCRRVAMTKFIQACMRPWMTR